MAVRIKDMYAAGREYEDGCGCLRVIGTDLGTLPLCECIEQATCDADLFFSEAYLEDSEDSTPSTEVHIHPNLQWLIVHGVNEYAFAAFLR